MKLSLLQLPARSDELAASLQLVNSLLSVAPAELALLPEAALTGYVSARGDFDLTRFAEPRDGPTASALSQLAIKHRCALVGPLIERDGERVYNSLIGFDRSGTTILHYRKRYPWYPEKWATPGDLPHPVMELSSTRVTCAICFDLHFVERDLPQADLLLFASAWVDDGAADSRTPALQALARRRRMAIANANWGEGEPRIRGQGRSCVIGREGTVLGSAGAGLERFDVSI